MAGASFAGRLLVATPALGEDTFARTVVLLLDHDEHGALGVILNRPSGTDVDDPLPGWELLAAEPGVVFVGGPVSPQSAICLAAVSGEEDVEGFARAVGSIGTVDLDADPGAVASRLGEVRVFAGYAGWGPGQLESELEENAWFDVDAEEGDAFSPAPETLWEDVLRRQPDRRALFATFPADPKLN